VTSRTEFEAIAITLLGTDAAAFAEVVFDQIIDADPSIDSVVGVELADVVLTRG